uniref:Elongation factor 1-gamma n=1 Tax=Panagrolaimus sp. ES5 TaxID=591445 RepID=A0AC34FIC7_9BILA
MTKATIYGNANSFRVQKALVAAKIGGHVVSVAGTHAPEKKFPTHVLPALEEGSVHLAGETAIAAHFLGTSFTPEIVQWVFYGEHRLQADVLAYVLPSVSAAKLDQSSIEAARQELFAKLQEFNNTLQTRTFLVGERFSYADVSVALDLLPAFQNVLTQKEPKLDQNSIEAARQELFAKLQEFNNTLQTRTFLVGERFSYADVSVALDLVPAFQNVLTEKEREQFVNVTRWFLTVVHQEAVKSIVGEVPLAEKVATFDDALYQKLSASAAPKKQQEKKKEEKKKPAAAAEEPEGGDETPQEKFVDPLATVPAGSFNMDAWKRCYSNEDTATKAIPYFWENFDAEHNSIWYAEYKYPEDLTLTFMSCNLIAGMFQRLEKLRKYAFGSACLFGTDNNSTISAVWIWRGQELVFPLCPDWTIDYESYTWKKLDPKSEEDKKIVNEYWLWEGDFGGKKFNQGKIFK